jgi:heptaprenyl diphosphate synthase
VLADAVARLARTRRREQARQEAVRWAGDAVAALAPLPPSGAHDALRAYAEAVVARTA